MKRRHPFSRNVKEVYEQQEQVGEGTYGKVYKAKDRATGRIVALKKIKMTNEREGFPITALREIRILQQMSHPAIVELVEVATSKATDHNKNKGTVFMAFEYLDHDLTGLMDTPGVNVTRMHIKVWMKAILSGLVYIHKKNILHRDIKGANLLIDNDNNLKIADWGLARLVKNAVQSKGKDGTMNKHTQNLTNRVVTLWYRAPELLLGALKYGGAVDVWSAGCLMGEMLDRKAMLPGHNEKSQMELIWQLCGRPDESNWPDANKLPLYSKIDWTKFGAGSGGKGAGGGGGGGRCGSGTRSSARRRNRGTRRR